MCIVSDKIKFCTCDTPIHKLKNFWILHRFIKGKNILVIGEVMMPYHMDADIEENNRNLLLKRINEMDAFDIELNAKTGDLLQIGFAVDSGYQHLTYGFKYTGKKWKPESYDPLRRMWHHESDLAGKIRNAKVRKQQWMK
jgi:hypothetical protein